RLKPNKDLLSGLINQANGLNRANYTSASLKAVDAEVEKANVVLNNSEATIEEVETAINALTKALEGLVANPINPPVDTSISEIKSGDTTVGVKTGDNSLIGIFASLSVLSVAGLSLLRKKEN
ncbi:LPXTG cell wall anchor domain-containing protein, partial [Thomasclavelia cocleata]